MSNEIEKKKNDFFAVLEQKTMQAVASFIKDPDKQKELFSGFLYCLRKNPSIKSCDPASIITALSEAAQYDLLPGARQECALIPYGKDLTFQPMVRGVIKLAYRAGIKSIDCEVIYVNDVFEYEQGSDIKLKFQKNIFGDRGKVRGAYAVITHSDGTQIVEVMTLDQIRSIQDRAKNKKIWSEHWDEMARKTVIKRACKRSKSEDENLRKVIEVDNSLERPDYSTRVSELNDSIATTVDTGVFLASSEDEVRENNQEDVN